MGKGSMFKYYAFISYSHKDKKIAKKLQAWLEHYHLPSKVIESHPDLPKKLSPVFIDESDLIARDGSLTESLKHYLDESNYLILICLPNNAKSS
ncbi:MAG: toll/interleukin-1 receptor domain-containing protein [Synergistaceae bacterium]|nr:toll/interleukin-1 receptor domain-containing protein [Synergistaceae bacterium]